MCDCLAGGPLQPGAIPLKKWPVTTRSVRGEKGKKLPQKDAITNCPGGELKNWGLAPRITQSLGWSTG